VWPMRKIGALPSSLGVPLHWAYGARAFTPESHGHKYRARRGSAHVILFQIADPPPLFPFPPLAKARCLCVKRFRTSGREAV